MHNLYSMCILSVFTVGYVHHVKAHPVMVQCGVTQTRQSRIINGTEAGEYQFPWIASIQRNGVHLCGGTVISGRYVLSAAHCFSESGYQVESESDNNDNWTIILGLHDVKESNTESTAIYGLSKVIKHPEFKDDKNKLLLHDIVLLELSDNIKWTDHIQPICLPTVDVREYKDAVAAGWGEDFRYDVTVEENRKLRFVNMDIYENSYCIDKYQEKRLDIKLTETHMCAGKAEVTQDTSQGDSGGPLQVNLKGKTVLVGITSAATNEDRYPKPPGIYTRVFAHMDWIMQHIREVSYYSPVLSNTLN